MSLATAVTHINSLAMYNSWHKQQWTAHLKIPATGIQPGPAWPI